RGPHARLVRRIPAPRGQAGGAGGARGGGGEPGRQERAVIQFQENGLAGRHPDLAIQFEREIAEAAGTGARAVCRIEMEGSDPRAPDRARVVLVEPDTIVEWTVAL